MKKKSTFTQKKEKKSPLDKGTVNLKTRISFG